MSKKYEMYEKELLERLNEFIQVDKVYYQYLVDVDKRLRDTLFLLEDDGWLIINSHGSTEEFATVMNEEGNIDACYRYILAISYDRKEVKLYLTNHEDEDDMDTQIRELKTRSGKIIDINELPVGEW